MTTAALTGLNVYPVKSCRGISVARARIGVRGLMLDSPASPVGDREWMIVDGDGRFITQREVPQLALVDIAITPDALRLAMRGMSSIDVPLAGPRRTPREVLVWQSSVPGHDEGDAVAAWLTAALGVEARLVRFDKTYERRCNPEFAGDSGAHTAFADGYPLLLAGDASLADLNQRLAAKACDALPMSRFRPNIVLAGLPAYEEDHLDTLEIDDITIKLVKPCTRCIITTTDQATAIRGVEPLPTLAVYRYHERVGWRDLRNERDRHSWRRERDRSWQCGPLQLPLLGLEQRSLGSKPERAIASRSGRRPLAIANQFGSAAAEAGSCGLARQRVSPSRQSDNAKPNVARNSAVSSTPYAGRRAGRG